MTVYIQQLPNTGSVNLWISLFNQVANAVSNNCVTTNSNTAVGNASISGSYICGNSTVNAAFISTGFAITNAGSTYTFSSPNSSQIASVGCVLTTQGWVSGGALYSNISIQTSGTGQTLIDNWPLTQYISAKYQISVKDNTANNFYASELLVLTDGVNGYVTEYAQLLSNSVLGTFSASSNSTNFLLYFTPTSTNTSVRFIRSGA